jgi:ADP-ribose pyrophosphatase
MPGRSKGDGSTIETLQARTVYSNPWMTVREDTIRRPDGSEGLFGVVVKPDYAIVIPIDGTDVLLVQQYRYPVAGRYWELPQGSWEDRPDSDPEDLARGELEEETGMVARSIEYIGHLYQAYAYATQGAHVFVAGDLTPGRQRLSRDEQGLVVGQFSPSDVRSMISNGTIKDAASVAALYLFEHRSDAQEH